jgi:ketosteroid isomerase-like protein
MGAGTKIAIIKRLFAAFRSQDRGVAEELLSEDFTFTSPYDDRIDKAAYFERCWPNAKLIEEHVLEKTFVEGDEAFVLYKCRTRDGREFRNTEFMRFDGARICEVNVFFGAAYRAGVFIPDTPPG